MSETKELSKRENGVPVHVEETIQQAIIAAVSQQVGPVMMQIAESMRAMQEIMETMQRDAARRSPLTSAQRNHLAAAVRERAHGIVTKRRLPRAAYNEAMREIRKKLYRRWGVNSIGEIPAAEYQAALDTVENWDETDIVTKYM